MRRTNARRPNPRALRLPAALWLAACLAAPAGCGGDPLAGTVKKPPQADTIDLSRPFGNAAPPPSRKSRRPGQAERKVMPKNPKLNF